jgi:hypothetical protein
MRELTAPTVSPLTINHIRSVKMAATDTNTEKVKWPAGIRPQGAGLRIFVYREGNLAYSETMKGDCGPEHLRQAVDRRNHLLQWHTEPHNDADFESKGFYSPQELRTAHSKMFVAARKRDEYTLTPEDERELELKAGGMCQITGISFAPKPVDSYFRNPYAPSLDRIDSSKGYHKDNVRLVLCAVNTAMNEWGLKLFDQIASKYVAEKLIRGC